MFSVILPFRHVTKGFLLGALLASEPAWAVVEEGGAPASPRASVAIKTEPGLGPVKTEPTGESELGKRPREEAAVEGGGSGIVGEGAAATPPIPSLEERMKQLTQQLATNPMDVGVLSRLVLCQGQLCAQQAQQITALKEENGQLYYELACAEVRAASIDIYTQGSIVDEGRDQRTTRQLEAAVKCGHPDALFQLGCLKMEVDSFRTQSWKPTTPKEKAEGWEILKGCAEDGNLDAMVAMWEYVVTNEPDEKTEREGLAYLEKAAYSGQADAMSSLADLYRADPSFENYLSFFKEDLSKAAHWYEESAKAGKTNNYNLIGRAYSNRGLLPSDYVDFEKAIYWLEKNALQENRWDKDDALDLLGGVWFDFAQTKDSAASLPAYKKALHWFFQSSEKNSEKKLYRRNFEAFSYREKYLLQFFNSEWHPNILKAYEELAAEGEMPFQIELGVFYAVPGPMQETQKASSYLNRAIKQSPDKTNLQKKIVAIYSAYDKGPGLRANLIDHPYNPQQWQKTWKAFRQNLRDSTLTKAVSGPAAVEGGAASEASAEAPDPKRART